MANLIVWTGLVLGMVIILPILLFMSIFVLYLLWVGFWALVILAINAISWPIRTWDRWRRQRDRMKRLRQELAEEGLFL